MIKGYRSFSEYVSFIEGATVQGGNNGMNKDQQLDLQIAKNPQLLQKPGSKNPLQDKSIIDQATKNKMMNPSVSMAAAYKAAKMAQDQNN